MSAAMKWAGIGVAVAGIGSPVACTLLVPYNELQCVSNSDCAARGRAFAGARCVANVCQEPPEAGAEAGADAGADAGGLPSAWACVSEPSEPINTNPQVNVQFVGFDQLGSFTYTEKNKDGGDGLTFASYTPLPGVSVVACTPDDPGCMLPETTPATTDDAGIANLAVAGSFAGFYFLTKPDYFPELLFPAAHLLAADKNVHYPVTLLSNDSIGALSSAFGVMSGAGDGGPQGILLVTVYDCADQHGGNVAVTTSPSGGVTLYTANGFPANGATATSPDGQVAILDLPTGSVTVTATLQGVTPAVVVGTAHAIIRSGAMTWVFIRPRTH